MKKRRVLLMCLGIALIFSTAGYFVRQHLFPVYITPFQNRILYVVTFSLILILLIFFTNINQQLERILPFSKNTRLRVFLQLTIGSAVILTFRLLGNYIVLKNIPLNLNSIGRTILFVSDVFLALTVNLAVLGQFIIEKWKETFLRAESLEKEKLKLQHHHLKNRVNPHFLFNSFSSLQSLIQINPALASEYVGQLAKVYRYVTKHKENSVVSIATELDFLNHYIHLLKIRYDTGIEFEINPDEHALGKGIITVTLQMLIDNALKHNESHPDRPLKILISSDEHYLTVANNLQFRESMIESNSEGLKQLKSIYRFYSEFPVEISAEDGFFTVRLPLLYL
jgi:sensor histidine kinase YesM